MHPKKAEDGGHGFMHTVEVLLKGPETQLPDDYGFYDEGGHFRRAVRLAWWNSEAMDWIRIAASVPDPEACLPKSRPPSDVLDLAYPFDAPPVFFGHYWLQGTPTLQSANALCLDYSAGLGGPLLACTRSAGSGGLNLNLITAFK